jgi:hypothetical protein
VTYRPEWTSGGLEGAAMPAQLELASRRGIGFELVEPSGELRMGTAPELRRRLVQGLLERRVVVDLKLLVLADRAAALVFPTALAQAGGWPRARLALFAPAGAMREALYSDRITDLVPTCEQFPAAVAALDERPAMVRRTSWLPLSADLTPQARDFVERCHQDWDLGTGLDRESLDRLQHLVLLVAGRADTVLELAVELGPSGLLAAVRSWAPSEPPANWARVLGGPPFAGAVRHRDGFTVWAALGSAATDGLSAGRGGGVRLGPGRAPRTRRP